MLGREVTSKIFKTDPVVEQMLTKLHAAVVHLGQPEEFERTGAFAPANWPVCPRLPGFRVIERSFKIGVPTPTQEQ